MRKLTLIFFLISLCLTASCSKNESSETAAELSNKLQTQSYSTSGLDLEQLDINKDGKVDQRIYSKNGVVQYAVRDLNFDNIQDMTSFYENGQLVRDEIDLDYDGICDVIVTYNNGVPVKKEFSTDFEGNRHGIQYFDTQGNRTEIHRDTNNDGMIDLIEYYHPNEEQPYKTEKKTI